eukprot:358279-Prymnesium_polylepis.1
MRPPRGPAAPVWSKLHPPWPNPSRANLPPLLERVIPSYALQCVILLVGSCVSTLRIEHSQ